MGTVSTADLYDERGEELQSCSVQLRHYGRHTSFEGVVTTIRCHRDNAIVKATPPSPVPGESSSWTVAPRSSQP